MELSTPKTSVAWDVLLEIRDYALHHDHFNFLCFFLTDGAVHGTTDDTVSLDDNNDRIILTNTKPAQLSGNYLLILIDQDFSILELENTLLEESELSLIDNYLPYCLLPWWAKKYKTTYAISHFAQSLDGKIATYSGHSKWIGNNENLVHAHRMRALCDGILIGGNTLQRDSPKLTVRHVQGSNPVKIIVGNSQYTFDSILASRDKTVFFTSHNGVHVPGLDVIICNNSRQGYIDPREILTRLYSMGIYSVYIEGGAYTASQFLLRQALHEVQLYLAPSIMGSGIGNFSLPAIEGIDESIQFRHHRFFKMGNGIMFAGCLKHGQYEN